jgi:hypothetical protein
MSREMAVRLVGLSEDEARTLVNTEPGLGLTTHRASARIGLVGGPAVIDAFVIDGFIWSIR